MTDTEKYLRQAEADFLIGTGELKDYQKRWESVGSLMETRKSSPHIPVKVVNHFLDYVNQDRSIYFGNIGLAELVSVNKKRFDDACILHNWFNTEETRKERARLFEVYQRSVKKLREESVKMRPDECCGQVKQGPPKNTRPCEACKGTGLIKTTPSIEVHHKIGDTVHCVCKEKGTIHVGKVVNIDIDVVDGVDYGIVDLMCPNKYAETNRVYYAAEYVKKTITEAHEVVQKMIVLKEEAEKK